MTGRERLERMLAWRRWVVAATLTGLALGTLPALADGPGDDERVVVSDRHVRVLKDGAALAGDDAPVVLADRIRVVTGDGTRPRLIAALSGRPAGFLGITMTDAEGGGVRVLGVIPGSPAEGAGLAEGDVIVEIGGKGVEDTRALSGVLEDLSPGDRVQITALRDGARSSFDVELGERPRAFALTLGGDEVRPQILGLGEGLAQLGDALRVLPEVSAFGECEEGEDCIGVRVLPRLRSQMLDLHRHARPKLGVRLTDVTPELREHLGGDRDAGVLVARVLAGTPAEDAGLEVGDLITAIDGSAVKTSGDLIRALRDADGRTVEIDLIRDRRSRSIDVRIPEPAEHDPPDGPTA